MIYYFSGTGNSKWVAEEVAKGTDDVAVNIIELLKTGEKQTSVKKGENIGIIFPVYAWQAPEIVTKFVKTIKYDDSNFVYAICTCGEEIGLTIKKLAKNIKIDSGYSIIMPNNYILGFDIDSEEVEKEKIGNATKLLLEIIENIKEKEKIFDIHTGKMCGLKSNFANYFFNKFGRGTKEFRVEEQCVSCGLCEEVCPTECIKLIDGKPIWTNNCLLCLACLNYCPEKAIQYGNGTKNKGRYFFKE